MREVAGPGVEVTVVTFDCHPLSVLRPERAPRLLTGIDVKLELLASCGVDTTCVVTFDNQRAQEEPEQFVTDLLVERLAATTIVVGEDFKFGRNRRGDVELLRKMGSDLGFSVTAVELAESGSEPISSTRIREFQANGGLSGPPPDPCLGPSPPFQPPSRPRGFRPGTPEQQRANRQSALAESAAPGPDRRGNPPASCLAAAGRHHSSLSPRQTLR